MTGCTLQSRSEREVYLDSLALHISDTHTHTRTHTRTHMCTHTCTRTCTHVHTRARTHARTRTHTHTHSLSFNMPDAASQTLTHTFIFHQVFRAGPKTSCLLYIDNVGCMFYMLVLIIAVPAVVLIVVYGSIVMVVLSRSRKVQPTIPVPPSLEDHRQQQSQQLQQQLQHSARREKRAIRLAITCGVVTFLFIACWLPVHIIAFVFWYGDLPVAYIHMSNTLVYFHSSMNPAVYFCVDPRFRSVLARFACRGIIAESSVTETGKQRQDNDQRVAGQSRDQGVTETDKL